jgi:RHS repeat-associated protein
VTGANNQLVSDGTYNYQYDGEGNRTKRTNIATGVVDEYVWDYRNRLTTVTSKDAGGVVTQTVGYEYDVDDQRVSKTVNGVVEKYIIDRNQIAYVTDASGTQTFHYLYGTNIDAVMAQDSPTGMVWSLSDRLGSVNLLADAGGTVVDKRTFDSFGRVLSETNPGLSFRYGYTGREQDGETGLDYYRARYYDAANGRFISVDPAGFGAGDTNLYRYVGNSSTLYTDPSGEIVPLLAFGLLIAAGGLLGAGYGVANHLDNGGSLDNIDLQDIWEKATIGAFTGGASFVFGAAASATAAWAGVAQSTIQAGGLIVGAAFTGWQAGTGINNIQNGKPYTGALDLVSAGLGAGGLFKGYQGYRQTLTAENITRSGIVYDVPGNPRPISQVGDPQLNSTGKIVPTQSSALATTSPSRNQAGTSHATLVHSEYSNPELLKWQLANDAGIPSYIDFAKPDNVAGLSYENLMQHYQLRGFEVVPKVARSSSSGKAKIFQVPNHPDIQEVQYHPGGKTHGDTPYYKFTLRDKSEIRIVPEPDKFYPGTISPRQKYFNAKGQEMTYDYSKSEWIIK